VKDFKKKARWSRQYGMLYYTEHVIVGLVVLWVAWWLTANTILNTHFLIGPTRWGERVHGLTSKVNCYSTAKHRNLILQREGSPSRFQCEPIPKDDK
jgi:hypothetical protein